MSGLTSRLLLDEYGTVVIMHLDQRGRLVFPLANHYKLAVTSPPH